MMMITLLNFGSQLAKLQKKMYTRIYNKNKNKKTSTKNATVIANNAMPG